MERLHKVSAGFIFAFICLHFANHLVGLQGQGAHQQFLEAARLVYRHPIVEIVLLMAFVIQIITGVALSRQIWMKKKDFIHQLQAASGTFLAAFIIIHVAWVFLGRLVFALDTNFDYAAVTLTGAWRFFFLPLYALAIMAVFAHVGCICYDIFKKTSTHIGWLCLIIALGCGVYVTWLILMMYLGKLYPITIGEPYLEIFGGQGAFNSLETLSEDSLPAEGLNEPPSDTPQN